MKKLLFLLLAVVLLMPSGVYAYSVTITDPAGDQIGSRVFDSFSIEYTVNENPISIKIGTNYPAAGQLVGGWQTHPADLLLDGSINGVGWDYAIPLVDHGTFFAGRLYSITSMLVSDDFEPIGGGYGYNHNVPVRLEQGTDLGMYGTWQWSSAGTDPDYNIEYTLANWWWDDASGGDLLQVGWATATCANDPIGMNPVPEPATMLLLGVGLIGLAGFGRKKFKKNA